MKYTAAIYENCRFYGDPSGTEQSYRCKLVKSRATHTCVNCEYTYPKGTYFLLETCILEGEGRKSAYTCTVCLDKWIDLHPELQSV